MQIPQALLASSVLLMATAGGPAITKTVTPCQDPVSTLELNRCLDQALKQSDADLLRELKQVALDVAEVPSTVFSTLWRDNLTDFVLETAGGSWKTVRRPSLSLRTGPSRRWCGRRGLGRRRTLLLPLLRGIRRLYAIV